MAKVRCHIQGRKLVGKKQVKALKGGGFVYKGQLYDINDFPEGGTINIDKTVVPSYGTYMPAVLKKKKSKRKQPRFKKNYCAHLLSNVEDCPDVQSLLEVSEG